MKDIYSKEHQKLVNRIRESRLENGLTQKQVADSINRTQSYISKLENGQLMVGAILLKKLADLYKKNIEFFTNE